MNVVLWYNHKMKQHKIHNNVDANNPLGILVNKAIGE